MSFETFVARRYFGSGQFFTSVSTWISILGVMLGVATVCVVMSLHNGFESEIRQRLLGTTSHISIFPLRGELIEEYDSLVMRLEAIEGVEAASPFIYYKAAISSEFAGDGVIVRGIDPEQERRTSNLVGDMAAGDYSFEPLETEHDTLPGMIVGNGLADRLGVFLGDPIVLYSLRGDELRKNTRPRVAKFYVSGIFETGMYDFDGQMVYIGLADAQKLFRTGDAVTAAHLKLSDIYRAQAMTPVIDSLLEFRYDVIPWNVLHKNLFSWIAIEKKVLFLGFILIVIVAAFSIISTLVMLAMEKRAEIGILKTIGFTPASVRKVFVYKGLAISGLGVGSGWVLAWVVAMIQNHYRVISLPADIYFISYVPVEWQPLDFLAAGAVAIVVSFLASLYPSTRAAAVSVIDVLRR